uniref:DUF1995 domain-containing protein n=1 Tax=Trieres chinensis TaxID=1514140 RepID=A0A7S2A2Q8_TRICV|mmetsp:Transcript_38648/g.78828  ORF Transcript_38648/g.78828 Transcript_38648/m.78828 type:complete len:299 (+) Transcript_38648:223-1119(+)|eukprot:CAMPEP_0183295628 /NCGR_PEP_ID=MMETSP0160_2-20130417/3519_1 /TAXON_ID=2839 ORGANISM="Odontella Sinensis, Strain Grunow 1884" /NCGR_SAMPLE_ID=MMETSP0160_2 /ASSEMBLY_ACC=CAM_ASM_000250 /LENGTH=298 /DNA_ID=CAMNT_0025457141 /DNA_START=198 /DNA_END=1094 /DNA_ORIENTATION=+
MRRLSWHFLLLLYAYPTCSLLRTPTNVLVRSNTPGYCSRSACKLSLFGSGSSAPKIPASTTERDNQAINSVKAAIASPKSSLPLIECEFPPLQALNKLGDGSLRSAIEAEKANLAFATKLIQSISPIPFIGPNTWLLTSESSSNAFFTAAKKAKAGSTNVHPLKQGLPNVGKGDICIFVTPSSRSDYMAAQKIASSGVAGAVVIINGFAKDQKSVPAEATMGYFLKPLTYNSQVVGYLTRCYPSKWAVVDIISKEVLGSFDDSEILVRGTNTPDLRQSGKLVQKSVDDRAIRARNGLQ